MSQIFDALLRSETERTGTGQTTQTEATELLRSVENAAASQWATFPLQVENDAVSVESVFLDVSTASSSHADIFTTNGLSRNSAPAERADIWNQFESLTLALQSEGRLMCVTDKGSPMAEAFRLLGVRLRDIRKAQPLRKVLVTSTVPREGKSTVAANLACALASKSGEKVLLIEGDIRRPSLSHIFNMNKVTGICELLRGERSLRDSIYHLEGAGIWIMPSGSSPATPLELLQSSTLPTLIDQLASLFDWVVIDSPPVLPLADTSIWTRMVDGILLVTRQGVTQKKQLQRGLRALESKKMIGALLNCWQDASYSNYYYSSSDSSKPAAD